jgi:MOSC domain-containing protein YiiM
MLDGWGGGAFGEILDDGTIRVGDPVSFEEAE